jgi:biopolymer transport protein ExbD
MNAMRAPVSRRPRRRRGVISLTALIDVVFMLLVFFMLASRLAPERSIDLRGGAAGGGGMVGGTMVEVRADGLRFAGEPVDAEGLARRLGPLLSGGAPRPVFLRAGADATVQQTIDALDLLRALGAADVAVTGDAAW